MPHSFTLNTPTSRLNWLWPAILLLSFSSPAESESTPRLGAEKIVQGEVTTERPAVGALISLPERSTLCTATLIGCRTVLTAAHCLCAREECDVNGPLTPASALGMAFQFGPTVGIDSYDIHPTFSDRTQVDDVAILHLSSPVTGIEPATINTTRTPSFGSRATAMGYGITSERDESSAGLKRQGQYSSVDCARDGLPNPTNLCFLFAAGDSGICSGDSGGPDFVDFGSGPRLAGIHTAASSCSQGAIGYSQDVFSYRDFIAQKAGSDLGRACTELPVIGSDPTRTFSFSGRAGSGSGHSFELPTNARHLRVSLNAAEPPGTDLTLAVRRGASPTDSEADCRSSLAGSFETCDLAFAAAGTWHASVSLTAGAATDYQLTVVAFEEEDPGPSTPNAPSMLRAMAQDSDQVLVTWNDNSNDETEFLLERRAAGSSFRQIAALNADQTSYSDTGLDADTTYTYRLRAANGAGTSAYSNSAMVTTPGAPSGPCLPDAQTLCLNQGRFRVQVQWRTEDGQAGNGRVVAAGTVDSGLFYFFDPNNWEVLIKVLDGCSTNQRFWMFSAATTNLEHTLTVTDTETGVTRTYSNPAGTPAPAITDTNAFAVCP